MIDPVLPIGAGDFVGHARPTALRAHGIPIVATDKERTALPIDCPQIGHALLRGVDDSLPLPVEGHRHPFGTCLYSRRNSRQTPKGCGAPSRPAGCLAVPPRHFFIYTLSNGVPMR